MPYTEDMECKKCGEPWDKWGVFHGDMTPQERKKFLSGKECPSCPKSQKELSIYPREDKIKYPYEGTKHRLDVSDTFSMDDTVRVVLKNGLSCNINNRIMNCKPGGSIKEIDIFNFGKDGMNVWAPDENTGIDEVKIIPKTGLKCRSLIKDDGYWDYPHMRCEE